MPQDTIQHVEPIHEAVSPDKLDDMLRAIYNGRSKNDAEFRRHIRKGPSRKMRWENIRHLRVVGDDDAEKLEHFIARGIPRGFYLNADGTWLLMILPEKPHLGDYLTRCGSYLESLYIMNTQMYSRDWSRFTNLKEIYLEDNRLLDTMEQLDGLQKLESLLIINCPSLTTIHGLGKLRSLASLSIFQCDKLTTLPGLGHLTQLRHLNLLSCGITALPGLGNLTQLSMLDLSSCGGITALPGLEKLTQLTHLELYDCSGITSLPELEHLTQLISLKLNNCQNLTVLPGVEKLTRLERLDLTLCVSLRHLPTGLRRLTQLRLLSLAGLRLQDLPDWLPEIAERFITDYTPESGKNKAAIWLVGTTVDDIPDMSIFEQPYEMVVKWFADRERGKTQPLNEIKVVFLGDGEAGKSHTIARLMNDGGEPIDYTDKSTPGIVIKHRRYTVDGRQFQVHYWDFGGQEIMHSMHRIFLTGRTMYVVLLNARDDTQGDRARYWLHNIKSFAPDAPVLLVLNKIDQNQSASVDEVDLRGRYEKLTQIVRLSALEFSRDEFNESFTAVLLDEIQKTGFLDAPWRTSWTRVKERLENMTSHYILGDEYQTICNDCQVDDDPKDLLHWFNDLGVSFCCCGDREDYELEDHVILRPDWITNALYIILFNKLEGAVNGLIPHRSIHTLLRSATNNPEIRCTLPQAKYNTGDVQYVLGIMRKFNLSFTDGNGNEFIPMLCQQNSTVDIQYYYKDADILEFNMEFDYLPNNLLHRLMVERHAELDISRVWRTGAGFRFPELGYSAVVVIDGNTLRFFIRHTKPMHRPNTYLTMLKAHVDRIIERMGLKAPTCQLIYKLDGKRDAFDFENLKLRMEVGQTRELAPSHRRMILIADILNQSAPDGLEDEKKLLDAIARACRNIQGEPDYYLNGDGKGMEDKRNRRVRDDLSGWGYNILDQSQRGLSGSGKSIGELDLLLFNDKREPWTVIEALRISGVSKTNWNQHLDKLVGSYNYFGAAFSYLLTYVDANPGSFAHIWKEFKSHIQEHAPDGFTCRGGSFVDLNEDAGSQYIKTAKCQYDCGGTPITVYHIFARIPGPNE